MDLYRKQFALENEAHERALTQYKKQMEREENLEAGSLSLLNKVAPYYVMDYKEWLNGATKKQGAVRPILKSYTLKAEAIAYFTLKVLLEMAGRDNKLNVSTVSNSLAKLLYRENQFAEINLKLKQDTLSDVGARKVQRKYAELAKRNTAKVHATMFKEDETRKDMTVGLLLVSLAVELSAPIGKDGEPVKIFRMFKDYANENSRHMSNFITITEPVRKYVMNINLAKENTITETWPMVVPPVKWERGLMWGGGYLTPRGQMNFPLIRTRNMSEYKDYKLPDGVLEALNGIQETPWRINTEVLEVLKYVHTNTDGYLPSYQSLRELKGALRLSSEDFDALTRKGKADYFKMRSKKLAEADSNNSKADTITRQVIMGARFAKFNKIYYPHNFDTRGRIYSAYSAINPQSDKIGLSLLKFGESQILGDRGWYWFRVHGANVIGQDKVSFAQRVQFIDDNKEQWLAIAEDPIEYLNTWLGTGEKDCKGFDDPWNFLAWVFEYRKAILSGAPEQFSSAIPVRLDATCSGLQHYSMLLRDAIGAKATNVTGGKRNDIYQIVADKAIELAKLDINSTANAKDKQWKRILSSKGNLNRSTCKPTTMTKPYGVSGYGVRDQMFELHRTGKIEIPVSLYTKRGKEDHQLKGSYINWLADIIESAVDNVVLSAKEGMDYLVALENGFAKYRSIAGNEKKFLEYTTPTGFIFKNLYYNVNTTKIETTHGKTQVRLQATVGTFDRSKVKNQKARSGIAPNFIHSLDASHLLKVWDSMQVEHGVNCIATIHDSFGVHAGHCDDLLATLKRDFADMYSINRLHDLHSQVLIMHPDMADYMPELPKVGDLDVNDVNKAVYTFS